MPAARTSNEIWSHVRDLENALYSTTVSGGVSGGPIALNVPGIIHPSLAPFGNLTQVANPGVPARTNAHLFGYAGWTDTSKNVTQVAHYVAVPVEVGDIITNVNLFNGATISATPTNDWAALYQGVGAAPALLAQTADSLTVVTTISARITQAFATPYTVKAADCPNGYIYVSLMSKAGTVETVATASTPTVFGYQLVGAAGAGSPIRIAGTHGSGLTTTAPATIVDIGAKATAAIVVLN